MKEVLLIGDSLTTDMKGGLLSEIDTYVKVLLK